MIAGIGMMKLTLGKFITKPYNKLRRTYLHYQEKRLQMKKEDLGNILATQLIECVNNRKYGYTSSSNPTFSHLEEAGKVVMLELIERMVPVAQKIHEQDTKNRAEQLMMDTLKK